MKVIPAGVFKEAKANYVKMKEYDGRAAISPFRAISAYKEAAESIREDNAKKTEYLYSVTQAKNLPWGYNLSRVDDITPFSIYAQKITLKLQNIAPASTGDRKQKLKVFGLKAARLALSTFAHFEKEVASNYMKNPAIVIGNNAMYCFIALAADPVPVFGLVVKAAAVLYMAASMKMFLTHESATSLREAIGKDMESNQVKVSIQDLKSRLRKA